MSQSIRRGSTMLGKSLRKSIAGLSNRVQNDDHPFSSDSGAEGVEAKKDEIKA